VHLDGYDLLPYLTGETDTSPRNEFFYFSDDGDLVAMRYDNWKVVFMEQRVRGTAQVWHEPMVTLRIPKLFNLRTDPYERADTGSNTYWEWKLSRSFLLYPMKDIVGGSCKRSSTIRRAWKRTASRSTRSWRSWRRR